MSHYGLTKSEFVEYMKCINNIKVGDEVEFYVEGAIPSPYRLRGYKTPHIGSMMVVGIEPTSKAIPQFANFPHPSIQKQPAILAAGRHNDWGWAIGSFGPAAQGIIKRLCPDKSLNRFRFVGRSMFVAGIRKG